VGVAPIPAPTFFFYPHISSLQFFLVSSFASRACLHRPSSIGHEWTRNTGNNGDPFHKGQRNDGIAVLMNRVDEAWWLP
jgi:hypothetical protein